MNKRKNIAFNSSTPILSQNGVHPSFRNPGAQNNLGPAYYNPKSYSCAYKKEAPMGETWRRKENMEEFSKYRNFKNIALLKYQEYLETLHAPGVHDVEDINHTKAKSSIFKNISFGTGERFKTDYKDEKLPPGIHSPDIMKSSIKQPLTNVPQFEWDGFIDRFKQEDPSFRLPPNQYTNAFRGTNTADIVRKEKGISGRGPVDLASTKRDEFSIKNHFAVGFRPPDVCYLHLSDIDHLLHDACYKKTGKFLKAPRFPKKPSCRNMMVSTATCYKDPDLPGPANYDLSAYKGIKKTHRSKYLFDSSNQYPRGKPIYDIKPGPGRYSVRQQQNTRRMKQASWVFKTTYARTKISNASETEYSYLIKPITKNKDLDK